MKFCHILNMACLDTWHAWLPLNDDCTSPSPVNVPHAVRAFSTPSTEAAPLIRLFSFITSNVQQFEKCLNIIVNVHDCNSMFFIPINIRRWKTLFIQASTLSPWQNEILVFKQQQSFVALFARVFAYRVSFFLFLLIEKKY